VLPQGQAAAFEAHSTGCPGCADLLAHAKQGQEWLEFLHAEPEIPDALVSKILDKTVGAGAIPVPVLAGAGQGAGAVAMATPRRLNFHETRLLMTVAMAFFSIAVTLSMTGVKFSNLRLADLRPSTIGNTLSRNFYGAREQVAKFYANARLVYEVESKVRELRRDTQSQQAAPAQQKKQAPHNGEKDGRLNPPPAPGDVLNAEQRLANGLDSSAEARLRQASQRVLPNTEAKSSKQTAENEPEVKHLNSPGPHPAGPRRTTSAGYKGRSLA
ncbi:MAG: hypothetical protein WA294_20385, partial [Acidobacteriaceae bacterium]